MSAVDIIILLVIVASLVYGWLRGVIRQLGALAGIFLGIVLCRVMGSGLASLIGSLHGTDAGETGRYVDSVIASVILFSVGYIGAGLAAGMVKRVTHVLRLGIFDRLAGVALATFSWLLGLSIALNVWQCVFPESEFIQKSTLNGGRAVHLIMEMAPDVLGSVSPSQLFGEK